MKKKTAAFNKDRIKGVITAMLVLLLLFVLSIFMGFYYPDPPVPPEGVEIEMGGSGSSGGTMGQVSIPEPQAVSEATPSKSNERAFVTDHNPENPSSPVATPTTKTAQLSNLTQPEKPKQQVNPNAMFPKKGTSGQSGNGSSSGSGSGSGSGKNPGDGSGTGTGTGSGPSFSLVGRTSKSLPVPSYNSDKQGKVVIDVNVDQQGNVVDAIYNSKLSTTADLQLRAAALEAAKRSRFSVNLDATVIQRGTITYTFIKLN
jgi:TonB family protein